MLAVADGGGRRRRLRDCADGKRFPAAVQRRRRPDQRGSAAGHVAGHLPAKSPARSRNDCKQIEDLEAFVRKTGRAELDEHAVTVNISEIIASFDPAHDAQPRRDPRRSARSSGRHPRHRDQRRTAAGAPDLAHALRRQGPGGHQALRRRSGRSCARKAEEMQAGHRQRRGRRPTCRSSRRSTSPNCGSKSTARS